MEPIPAPGERFLGSLDGLRRDLERAVGRVCPPWLAAEREDIVQLALERLMRRFGPDDPPPNPTYLRKTAWSVTVDEVRRRRRRHVADPAALEAVEAPGPSPHQLAAGQQIGRAIRDCLLGLVTSRRRAVTCHLQGHTVPETARLLGANPKRAENLVYRGLTDLRACLAGKGFAP